jgi:hypothetical protein
MDNDSKLIFENYLQYKNNIVLESDGEKWENKSSAWFWLKTFDPTGLSSWPDVLDSAIEAAKRPADAGPWAMLFLNIFLALPNFGLLAFGLGGAGWMGLRGLAKSAIKGGDRQAIKVAEDVLKMAKDNEFVYKTLVKFGKTLEQKGIVEKSVVERYMKIIETGNLSKKAWEFTKGGKGELAKDVTRAGRASFDEIQNRLQQTQSTSETQQQNPKSVNYSDINF